MNSAHITDITNKSVSYLDVAPPAELVATEEDTKTPAICAGEIYSFVSLSSLAATITFLIPSELCLLGDRLRLFVECFI